MAKSQQEIDSWINRINEAEEIYNDWSHKFRTETLEKYYEGFQTEFPANYNDYFIMNLFFSVWQTKQPSLFFTDPQFSFTPQPGRRNWDPEVEYSKGALASDLVNTLVSDPKMDFSEQCTHALLDIGAYFGVVEIGWSGDWRRNSTIPDPIVNKDYDPNVSKVTVKTQDLDEELEDEWLFVKRIPAHRFRVGGNDQWKLEKCSWSGYYQYFRAIDLQLKDSEQSSDDIGDIYLDRSYKDNPRSGVHKVWTICDHKKKEIFMIDVDAKQSIGEIEKINRVPFKLIRFYPRRKGFYPIPYFFNWISNQNEVNESLDQLRAHRRRSKRVYQAQRGMVAQEELDKFATLPDGAIVTTERDDAIKPIQNAAADSSIIQAYTIAKDNFNVVSGTGAENLGDVDRVTATQASITARVGGIRSRAEREVVAKWLSEIGLEILSQAIERFTLPIWIKKTTENGAELGTAVQNIQQEWELINVEKLEGIQYNPKVTITSLSAQDKEEEKRGFMEFLALINQYPQFGLHPELIRECASKCNYNNEPVIRAMQEMAALQMMGFKAQAEQMVAGMTSSNLGQMTVEQAQPNTQAEIESQQASVGLPIE